MLELEGGGGGGRGVVGVLSCEVLLCLALIVVGGSRC